MIKNFILDTLFPISCLFCGRPGVWLCGQCLSKIEMLENQVCPYCEKTITGAGKICPACRIKFISKKKPVLLDGLIICARYRDLARLVHVYKYNFVSELSLPLAELMKKACLLNNLAIPDCVVPVPLHRKRERWRGFNQAELLADNLSQNMLPGLSIPVWRNLLIRSKFTAPQMKIKDYKKRQINLKNAFAMQHSQNSSHSSDNSKIRVALKDKKILLVDDICTTGSTLIECAKVLKSAGAQTVWGLVLARQEYKSHNTPACR